MPNSARNRASEEEGEEEDAASVVAQQAGTPEEAPVQMSVNERRHQQMMELLMANNAAAAANSRMILDAIQASNGGAAGYQQARGDDRRHRSTSRRGPAPRAQSAPSRGVPRFNRYESERGGRGGSTVEVLDDDSSGDGYGGGRSPHRFAEGAASRRYSEEEIAEREARKEQRAQARKDWADTYKRRQWLVAGALPGDMEITAMQSLLGRTVEVTPTVHKMLRTLTGFDASQFAARGGIRAAKLPVKTRMSIMANAILDVVDSAEPPPDDEYEKDACQERLFDLQRGLKVGMDIIDRLDLEFNHAIADPDQMELIFDHIKEDMEIWSDEIIAATRALPSVFRTSPPTSCDDFPKLPTPEWKRLKGLASRDTLHLVNKRLKAADSAGKNTAEKATPKKTDARATQTCRNWALGECTRSKCPYSHKGKKGAKRRSAPEQADTSTGETEKTKEEEKAQGRSRRGEGGKGGSQGGRCRTGGSRGGRRRRR